MPSDIFRFAAVGFFLLLISTVVISVVVGRMWVSRWRRDRNAELERRLKEYLHGMTMDDDPFLGQIKRPRRL